MCKNKKSYSDCVSCLITTLINRLVAPVDTGPDVSYCVFNIAPFTNPPIVILITAVYK